MPYYTYTARGRDGKAVKGQSFTLTKQQLVSNLQKDGLLVLSIKESAAAAEHKGRPLHRKARASDLILFGKEFAVLLENGIPIIDALDILTKQMSSRDLINAARAIKKDLENGSTLSNTFAKNREIFGDLWQYLIDAGETSGQLPFVLKQIVIHLEAQEAIRKKVLNALIYPATLILVASIAVLFFTFKIIPVFEGIFATLGGRKLPSLTLFIIHLSNTIRHNAIIGLVLIAVAVTVFAQIASTKRGRRAYEKALLATPVVGQLYLALAIERFATTLKILLKSGIPVIKAMEMAANTVRVKIFSDRIDDARAKVISGLPFSDALQQTAIFPLLAVQLVSVGEKTGNYAGMFEEISNYYKEVLDTALARFNALIEPAILIIMGGMIGLLVVSMFLPIFKLANL